MVYDEAKGHWVMSAAERQALTANRPTIMCSICGEREMIGVCEACGSPLCGDCAREFTNVVMGEEESYLLCVPCL